MRPVPAVLLVPLVLVPCLAGVDAAGADVGPHTKVALHATAATTKWAEVCTTGDPVSAGIPCSEYATRNHPVPGGYHVYLVVVRTWDRISGLSCGIRYDSTLAVGNWRSCADTEMRSNAWPASGGGDRILWDPVTDCQGTAVDGGLYTVAGVFYLYAYGDGVMQVTPNYFPPPEAEFLVRDCDGSVSDIHWIGGEMGFGRANGWNPCTEADGGCQFGGAEPKYCCCKPGAPEELTFQSSRWQFCEHEGGTVVTGPCATECADICPSVATRRCTWGSIKTRFE